MPEVFVTVAVSVSPWPYVRLAAAATKVDFVVALLIDCLTGFEKLPAKFEFAGNAAVTV